MSFPSPNGVTGVLLTVNECLSEYFVGLIFWMTPLRPNILHNTIHISTLLTPTMCYYYSPMCYYYTPMCYYYSPMCYYYSPHVLLLLPPCVTIIPPCVTITPPCVTITPPCVTITPPCVTITPPCVTITPPCVTITPQHRTFFTNQCFIYTWHISLTTISDTHWSFMQNIFYAAIFQLARNLPNRKVNLQLAIICASWIFLF